uniref:Uncharacterized protein n=1 Tax=Ananas comosus var. bracteatus TaxID=296719 RepID=A0A6V7Q6B4_ANACO|nr:unnamed protein product [Ananas comosus var. bracteatus]
MHHFTNFGSKYPPLPKNKVGSSTPIVMPHSRQFGRFGHVEQTPNGQSLSCPPKANNKVMYIKLPSPKVCPDSPFNLIGEENLHLHIETVCGTTTSAPIVKYSGDHYLSGATTLSVNRLVSMIQSSQKDTLSTRVIGYFDFGDYTTSSQFITGSATLDFIQEWFVRNSYELLSYDTPHILWVFAGTTFSIFGNIFLISFGTHQAPGVNNNANDAFSPNRPSPMQVTS